LGKDSYLIKMIKENKRKGEREKKKMRKSRKWVSKREEKKKGNKE